MAKTGYKTSSTKRIYTNPMAGSPLAASLYQKTANPMGAQPQAAPQQGAPQSPFSISADGIDPSKYTNGLIRGIELPEYERTDAGLFVDGFKSYMDSQYGDAENSGDDYYTQGSSDTSSTARATSAASRKIIDVAKLYIGQNRYVYGGFDCSKFSQEVAKKAGEAIPRTCATQFNYFKQKNRLVNQANARPGDLVYMKSGASPSGWHVGIYIGNGKMIDNAGRGKPIAVRNIKGRRIVGFGRMNIKVDVPKTGRVGTSNFMAD